MRIAFDLSSFMWTALFAGKDTEFGFEVPSVSNPDKRVWINTARHGYENVINMMTAALEQFNLAPIDAILVFEGMHSKQKRRAIDPGYKEGDEKNPENYVEFEKLRETMRSLWKGLGAALVQQDYVEGDDVLAYLAREAEQDLVIATGDGDLTILHGTNEHGSKIIVRRGHDPLGQHPYGPWDRKLITLYKALVGDTADKIRGVEGFGKKSFEALLIAYGEEGLLYIMSLLEAGNLGPIYPQVGEDKLIKMIVDQERNAVKSYRVAKLYPNWVNTAINPLQFEAGMVTPKPAQPDERLAKWYGQTFLVTAENYSRFMAWLPQIIAESPFATFDIETSTSEESDDWVANQEGEDRLDQLGSELTGFSLTLGKNTHLTCYFSVDHADTANITLEQARKVLELIPPQMHLVIQNFAFESCVCYQAFAEHWQDNGYRGFLPNMLDTKFENSYVDENNKLGLKDRSKRVLGYEQQTYDQTTKLSGPVSTLQPGGQQIRAFEQASSEGQMVDGVMQYPLVEWEERRYKMRELTAKQVFDYGTDDTICTAALHVYNRLVMEIEHTWQVYLKVEINAAYQHAVNFLTGMAVSVEKINELSAEDDKTYSDAWKIASKYLIDNKYEGTQAPVYGELTAADVKEAFRICTGKKMDTQMRILAKLVIHCREVENEPSFALVLGAALSGPQGVALFNEYVAEHFTGEPENPLGSPTKMSRLMYEIMGLPIRVRNKATDSMRAGGVYEGNPKTDQLAIEYALQMDATPEQKGVLEAFKLMQMVRTRRSLYYSKYPYFVHWKDGMVHPSHNQCATNTRRASESGPNKQQLPKHQKIEGQPARFREAVVPHKPGAVVVSMDFESQELKIIASYSQDENLVACYVGDNLKDVHSLTGLGVYAYKQPERRAKGHTVPDLTYEEFETIRHGDKAHPLFQFVKDDRNMGKKTNFTAEFGAMAPKVAQTLLISEEAAQAFLDAREAAFPGVRVWKDGVIRQAREDGYVRTMSGAMRHLNDAFRSGDRWVSSKAERQAVNTKVQGSAGEQTKLAEGRMWEDGLFFEFDAVCYGPIHDEVVASVMLEDLPAFLPRMHACMVAPFNGVTVPITSSISFGYSFGEQVEIGAQPTPEAIQAGLAELSVSLEK